MLYSLIPNANSMGIRNGQRRVDPLAAIFNRQNQTGKVSRQKQEYQRKGRDVNNTRQKSGSQAQVQRASNSNAAEAELLKSPKTQTTPVTIFSVYCHLAGATGA